MYWPTRSNLHVIASQVTLHDCLIPQIFLFSTYQAALTLCDADGEVERYD